MVGGISCGLAFGITTLLFHRTLSRVPVFTFPLVSRLSPFMAAPLPCRQHSRAHSSLVLSLTLNEIFITSQSYLVYISPMFVTFVMQKKKRIGNMQGSKMLRAFTLHFKLKSFTCNRWIVKRTIHSSTVR